jgi:hypothetical protein
MPGLGRRAYPQAREGLGTRSDLRRTFGGEGYGAPAPRDDHSASAT